MMKKFACGSQGVLKRIVGPETIHSDEVRDVNGDRILRAAHRRGTVVRVVSAGLSTAVTHKANDFLPALEGVSRGRI
jgi:hypothetical protein